MELLLGGVSIDTSGRIKAAEFLLSKYYLEVQEPYTSQEPSVSMFYYSLESSYSIGDLEERNWLCILRLFFIKSVA